MDEERRSWSNAVSRYESQRAGFCVASDSLQLEKKFFVAGDVRESFGMVEGELMKRRRSELR